MTDLSHTRPPIVTDEDREWALAQCPAWAVRAQAQANDWLDDGNPDDAPPTKGGPGVLIWDYFVTGEIERFERFYYDQRKTYGDWSTLWRKSWWPKADPARRYASLVPARRGPPYPTFRRGEPEFYAALRIASPTERKVWDHVGVVMFKPDDPRLAKIRDIAGKPKSLPPRSVAMTGDHS